MSKSIGFLLITHHPSLTTSLQLSAGDLSEWARPAVFALAASASVWVFRDARRRAEFGRAAVCAWALLTLLFPPVALPLYLAARLYTRRADADADATDEGAKAAESSDGARKDDEDEPVEDVKEGLNAAGPRARRGLAPTLLYAAVLVVAGAACFYVDYRSFDARLARAERAKLYQRPEEAIREYRAALGLREDAHTRKLLALELLQAGRAEEALDELRAAARAADEPDETLAFHTAAALGALGRHREAAEHYARFLAGPACAPPTREERCEAAAARRRAHEDAAGAAR